MGTNRTCLFGKRLDETVKKLPLETRESVGLERQQRMRLRRGVQSNFEQAAQLAPHIEDSRWRGVYLRTAMSSEEERANAWRHAAELTRRDVGQRYVNVQSFCEVYAVAEAYQRGVYRQDVRLWSDLVVAATAFQDDNTTDALISCSQQTNSNLLRELGRVWEITVKRQRNPNLAFQCFKDLNLLKRKTSQPLARLAATYEALSSLNAYLLQPTFSWNANAWSEVCRRRQKIEQDYGVSCGTMLSFLRSEKIEPDGMPRAEILFRHESLLKSLTTDEPGDYGDLERPPGTCAHAFQMYYQHQATKDYATFLAAYSRQDVAGVKHSLTSFYKAIETPSVEFPHVAQRLVELKKAIDSI